MNINIQFADVIVPIPINNTLIYQIPIHLKKWVQPGSRVLIPLGTTNILTGWVVHLHEQKPKYPTKIIIDALPEPPTVTPVQLQFFQWLADYYLCTLGEVINTLLPRGLQLLRTKMIQLIDTSNFRLSNFSIQEQNVLKALQKKKILSYEAVEKIVGKRINLSSIITSLQDKKIISYTENTITKYQPKKISTILFNSLYQSKEEEILSQLKNKPKQHYLLTHFLQNLSSHCDKDHTSISSAIPKQTVLAWNISHSALQALIKKKIFIQEKNIIPRLHTRLPTTDTTILLSKEQQAILHSIETQFLKKQVVLLQGVTGSGKTEIYIKLIQHVLHQNEGQVLFLIPEIALTTQITTRLQKIFGNIVILYHSKHSQNERIEIWNEVRKGGCRLVVGVRSALFLPFINLRLIIVDEEHDLAYKQSDLAPRYHTRESSIILASFHKAKVLLGSATPSIESYYNAEQEKYGFVVLKERFGNAVLPTIVFVDLKIEQQRKSLRENFSKLLIQEIEKALTSEKQVIIFQNRRGYAPSITCAVCGWIPMCNQCSVSLTYHQLHHYLSCHYCEYNIPPPTLCTACASTKLQYIGFGTEKLEETLQLFFPTKKIGRMDLDSMKGKDSYKKVIQAFATGTIDILVGTQMITKGLDFANIYLVGVLDIDRIIYFPDFRAYEKCFQLLTQVSGRAGRRGEQGNVIIQTQHPEHVLFHYVKQHDYTGMYKQELIERNRFIYPPYVRLIKIVLKHTNESLLEEGAYCLAQSLKDHLLPKYVLGPQQPLVYKIKNQFIINIFLKIHNNNKQQLKAEKKIVYTLSKTLLTQKKFKKIIYHFDVDPML